MKNNIWKFDKIIHYRQKLALQRFIFKHFSRPLFEGLDMNEIVTVTPIMQTHQDLLIKLLRNESSFAAPMKEVQRLEDEETIILPRKTDTYKSDDIVRTYRNK